MYIKANRTCNLVDAHVVNVYGIEEYEFVGKHTFANGREAPVSPNQQTTNTVSTYRRRLWPNDRSPSSIATTEEFRSSTINCRSLDHKRHSLPPFIELLSYSVSQLLLVPFASLLIDKLFAFFRCNSNTQHQQQLLCRNQ
jgi:hypothetical protein